MDKIKEIRAEIERHIKHYEKLERNDFQNGELYICQELFSFVNSLSEEPVCLDDGGAPSKQKCGDCTVACSIRVEEEPDDYTNFTQKEVHSRGYDEDYLNEKIAKASKSWKGVDVDKFMDEVRDREPDKDLEEAAVEYATTHLRNNEFPTADSAFIAGAKWQAEQDDRDVVFWKGMQYAIKGMKEDAVEGIYTKSMDGKNVFVESGALKIDPASVKVGDPVKLIIIKDDGKSD